MSLKESVIWLVQFWNQYNAINTSTGTVSRNDVIDAK